ncbi:MAG: aspartyl-trna synthetase [Amylibacter sp.]|jgi:SH3-like domain-containing protein|nr:aspartyl-trna synthetase [Amylibacter sp.]
MTRAISICMIAGLSLIFTGLTDVAASETKRGPVTNLPMPRFVSMKTAEGNVRRGPSLTHRVDWVFKHENTPLQVIAEYGHWRRVQDAEGQGGWMHYSLLSGARYVLVREDKIRLYLTPNDAAATQAFAQRGALLRLGSCVQEYCELSAQGADGWAKKSDIWGVAMSELRD